MKVRHCFKLGLIIGSLILPLQIVPAALGQESIRNSVTPVNPGNLNPGESGFRRVETQIVPSPLVSQTAGEIVNQLQGGTYSAPGVPSLSSTLQTALAIVLTSPTPAAQQTVVTALTNAGVSPGSAVAIVNAISGIFGESNRASVSGSESIGLIACTEHCQLAQGGNVEELDVEGLLRAIVVFNNVVDELEVELLRNPPNELLAIRSVIVRMVDSLQAANT